MNWISKLERKFGKYAIHNLMYYIIILYGAGFVIDQIAPTFYSSYLALDANSILHGQVWRIVTFLIHPPSNTSIFFIFFALYLYYMIGTSLERQWGAFRFNLYFFTGVLLHVIAAIVIYLFTGINFTLDTWYLNLSLFFAFAALYPDVQFLLFFIIPVKVKYLAILNGFYFFVAIAQGAISVVLKIAPNLVELSPENLYTYYGAFGTVRIASAIAALVSVLNFLIFYFSTRKQKRVSPAQKKRKKNFAQQTRPVKGITRHKCAVCGRTEKDGENLEFRFCSKCDGNYEYCQDHLFTHEHVKK